MSVHSRPRGSTSIVVRGLLGVILCLAAWSMVVLPEPVFSTGENGARPGSGERFSGERQKKKRVEEEERDDPKPKKRIEEEEDDKPRKRKVVRVEEEDDKPARLGIETTDLGRAAREAKHALVKELFASLALPRDEVKLRSYKGVTVSGGKVGGTVYVEPLPEYISDPQKFEGVLTLKIIDLTGKLVHTERKSGRSIEWIRYYERTAIKDVQDFRGVNFTRYPQDSAKYLTRYDQLLAAEQALAAVVRFHQSARERGVRKGDDWNKVADDLRKELLDVLLAQLHELSEAKSWNQAFALTRRMVETYTDPKDHERIAEPLARLLTQAVKDTTFSPDRLKEARQRLRQLEDHFPGSAAIKPIRDNLKDQARVYFARAQALAEAKRTVEAQAELRRAEEVWPELPGLRAFRLKIDDSYPTVRVGVRELPIFLSPALAATDSERRCVELLFESLVQLLPDDRGVIYYRPSLAVGMPRVVPLGRQFTLPRNAHWSDGGRLTGGDLRTTVELLKDGQVTGRCAAWGDLLEKASLGGDPFRVTLQMQRGFLDPLAVMSFKVLPARHKSRLGEESFAEKPISSGPFQYGGPGSEQGRPYVSLKANPYYGVRGDKLGLPRIKEVLFFAPPDPVKALQNKQIDVAFDLTAEQLAALPGDFEKPLPSKKRPNRRIWFLAVNHRNVALANPDLRVALARAINREQLLNDYFRKGLDPKVQRGVHHAINGPYPAGSWACNPRLVSRDKKSLDPHDAELARTKLKQALKKLDKSEVRLTLKYPAGDKQLAEALGALCKQVNEALPGVKLTLEERTPHDLRKDVEKTQSYELAYYSYDFPDESLWLRPLLGASGPAGSENYLGYNGALADQIQRAMSLRHFSQVREFAHAIHQQMLDSEMPFIPLWQLDPLYAYRKGAKLPPVDPVRVFGSEEP